MDDDITIITDGLEFAIGCLERGICPCCLNAGERRDNEIDMFGTCGRCGYRLLEIVEASTDPNAVLSGKPRTEL